jgi:predicted nucleotidyltransferase
MTRREDCLSNAVIAERLDEIRALCREFGVARLEVFGSVCTGEFDPERSDVDFLVEYPSDYEFGPWLTRYCEFEEALGHVLHRKADLVMIGALRNKWFRREADKTRTVVYDASQVAEVA